MTSHYIEEDCVQDRIESNNLPLGSITSAIVLVGQFRTDHVFHQIQQVLNSQQEVNVRDQSFRIIIEHVPTSRGAGYSASEQAKKKLIKETLKRFLRKHRQTVKSPPPEFSGGYCGVAALILGLKWLQLDETKRRKWAPLRYNGQKRRFRSEMYGVCRMVKVPHYMERNEDRPITLVELKRIFRENEMFSGYGLVVIDRDKENSVVAEISKDVQHSKTIYLCVTRGHYVFVKHMRNYFGFVRGFYCWVS